MWPPSTRSWPGVRNLRSRQAVAVGEVECCGGALRWGLAVGCCGGATRWGGGAQGCCGRAVAGAQPAEGNGLRTDAGCAAWAGEGEAGDRVPSSVSAKDFRPNSKIASEPMIGGWRHAIPASKIKSGFRRFPTILGRFSRVWSARDRLPGGRRRPGLEPMHRPCSTPALDGTGRGAPAGPCTRAMVPALAGTAWRTWGPGACKLIFHALRRERRVPEDGPTAVLPHWEGGSGLVSPQRGRLWQSP